LAFVFSENDWCLLLLHFLGEVASG
jgi:hypothetical protein